MSRRVKLSTKINVFIIILIVTLLLGIAFFILLNNDNTRCSQKKDIGLDVVNKIDNYYENHVEYPHSISDLNISLPQDIIYENSSFDYIWSECDDKQTESCEGNYNIRFYCGFTPFATLYVYWHDIRDYYKIELWKI